MDEIGQDEHVVRPRRPVPDRVGTQKELATALSALKDHSGLSIRRLAQITGVSRATLGGYFAGSHLPLATLPDTLPTLVRACGVTDPEEISLWVEALSRVRRGPAPRPAGAPAPYLGLAAFQPQDAERFFGREALTRRLCEVTVALRAAGGGLLVVVGASGAGKSSLLRAGLIGTLRADGVPELGPDIVIRLLTPGAHPLAALDAARAADAVVVPRTTVYVVDQFEETFTTCTDEQERRDFITALTQLAAPGGESATVVVVGLRADFFAQASLHPVLVPVLQDSHLVVGPMNETDLRLAMTEPARRAGVEFADGLADLLVRDLAPLSGASVPTGDAGALPLLSHVLLTMWERGQGRTLTVADYRDSGGIRDAVANTAETAYAGLPPAQQELARRVFMRLVHVGDGSVDTRRRIARGELLLAEDEPDAVREVLDAFITRRLLTADREHIEFSHEILVQAWPRLRDWIDADRDGLRIHRRLTDDAERWRDNGRDPGLLYRGGLLSAVEDWLAGAGRSADINSREREFLVESRGLAAAERITAARGIRLRRQLLGILTVLLVLAGLLAGVAVVQKRSADRQRSAALTARDIALSRQIATEADDLRKQDIGLAAQLSLTAYRTSPTPEARASLLGAFAVPQVTRLLGQHGALQSLALSADGHTLVAGGVDPSVRRWNITDRAAPRTLGTPLSKGKQAVYAVALSRDGRLLAAAGADRTVWLWALNGTRAQSLGALPDPPADTVYSLALSPDGRTLAAGGADRTVRLWDIHDPRHPTSLGTPLVGGTGYVQSVAFAPDSRTLAAGDADHTARLWDVTDPRHPRGLGKPLGADDDVLAVAFSPVGHLLAVGASDGSVRLWNVTRPARPDPSPLRLNGPTTWVNALVFSPDGSTLAGGGSDNAVWLWSTTTGSALMTLPHPSHVTAAAFLPDGHTLATAAADGQARLWDLRVPALPGTADPAFFLAYRGSGHLLAVARSGGPVTLWRTGDPRVPVQAGPAIADPAHPHSFSGAAAFSGDGELLAIGGGDGTVEIWNVADPAHPRYVSTLRGPTKTVQSVVFDPVGQVLAVGTSSAELWLWDLTTPTRPVPLPRLATSTDNYVMSVAFSPDGRLLVAGGTDKLVRVWNVSAPRRAKAVGTLGGFGNFVSSVAFAPSGGLLAAGSADNTVRLWRMSGAGRPGALGAALTGPKGYVYSVQFGTDGRSLAAGSGDGGIRVWDTTIPARPVLLAALTAPEGATYAVAFDPQNGTLASAGSAAAAHLWTMDPEAVARLVCATAGDPPTRAEWTEYVGASSPARPCGALPDR
ncbi:helix-turn-helix domain-containing protein [Streptomyces sp. NPDC051576]|uniref:nSTAND1 domain-containing NTPase n=1 Tax=Streptomyces sp. NPDC051576 TaxID=3155803 RepID=UPI0034399A9D